MQYLNKSPIISGCIIGIVTIAPMLLAFFFKG